MRKQSKNPAEVLRGRCVEIAKKIARLKANETCEHCGKKKKDGWQMHGSHIYPEGVYKSMSADVDNILCLCATCHKGGMWHSNQNNWHDNPIYFGDWFAEKYPELKERLRLRSQQSILCDEIFWRNKLSELKQELKKYE